MRAQLYSIQGLPAGRISIMARPRGGDWLLDEIKALREAGVDVLVSLLTPGEVMEFDLKEEAECCRRQDVIYLSFPIPDRSIPPFSASTFTFLEQLKGQVSAGKHIALHCRQGLGRAALMAASVLVLTGLSPGTRGVYRTAELLSIQPGVQTSSLQKQRVGTALDDAPGIDHQNLIGG